MAGRQARMVGWLGTAGSQGMLPPEPYRTVQFETFWRDRLWFEAHPDASECRRDYVEGEFWPQDEGVDCGSIEYVRIRMADFLGEDRVCSGSGRCIHRCSSVVATRRTF